jgi:hypothetical protein
MASVRPLSTLQDLSVSEKGIVYQGSSVVGRFLSSRAGGISIDIPLKNVAGSDQSGSFRIVLPASVATSDLAVRFISLQDTSGSTIVPLDAHTLSVGVSNILGDSHTKIQLIAPGSAFSLPFTTRFSSFFVQLSSADWAVTALALVLLALVGIGIGSRQLLPREAGETGGVPAGLKPLEMAILRNSEVSPRDIGAFIYDLAQRGFLQLIVNPGGTFLLPSLDAETKVEPYEAHFIPLVAPVHGARSLRDVLATMQEELFSLAVSGSYVEIYQTLSEKGYVQENPRLVHLRYKTTGIIIQVLSIAQMVLSYLFLGTMPGLLFLGAAGYLCGYLAYRGGYRLVTLTKLGHDVYVQTVAFQNYLQNPEPIGNEGAQGHLFYAYVPYAMVLHCEEAWLYRFREIDFYIPTWFSEGGASLYTPDEFLRHTAGVIEEIAQVFTKLKDPNVD